MTTRLNQLSFNNLDLHRFRSLIFHADNTLLERCDDEVKQFHKSIQSLRSRSDQFHNNNQQQNNNNNQQNNNNNNSQQNNRSQKFIQNLEYDDDDEDDSSDGVMMLKVCGWYKRVLEGRRVKVLDVKLASGWWGEGTNMCAGKLKLSAFKSLLVSKHLEWQLRKQEPPAKTNAHADKLLSQPGIFVFVHKHIPACKYVGVSVSGVFETVQEVVKRVYEGDLTGTLACWLIISHSSAWHFYFIPCDRKLCSEKWLRESTSNSILQHDSLWPHGLNDVVTGACGTGEVSSLRAACLRHKWPPERWKCESKRVTRRIDTRIRQVAVPCALQGESVEAIGLKIKEEQFQRSTVMGMSWQEIEANFEGRHRRDLKELNFGEREFLSRLVREEEMILKRINQELKIGREISQKPRYCESNDGDKPFRKNRSKSITKEKVNVFKNRSESLDYRRGLDDEEDSSSGSSLVSSLTATTIKTALDVKELERSRQNLLLKLTSANRCKLETAPLKLNCSYKGNHRNKPTTSSTTTTPNHKSLLSSSTTTPNHKSLLSSSTTTPHQKSFQERRSQSSCETYRK